ncbi:hypothetical protein [Demequina flava]|uniref:hypothetical protein n=1 Tax=Demequina flava TaxID=1095025 RepID=UPI000786154D|nr:hypothetical protein [Demequina flava]
MKDHHRHDTLHERLSLGLRRYRTALREEAASDRGDVPGWVLITLMSAGIVAVLWAVAESSLTNLFNDAINSVTGG